MTERLDDAFRDGALQQPSQADEMAIDLEDTSAMELDKENAKPEKRSSSPLLPFFFFLNQPYYLSLNSSSE